MPRPRAHEVDEVVALKYIRESVDERGYPPSQRELAAACGWSSPSQANNLIRLMEARGLIVTAPGIPRGLKITAAGMVAATEAV